MLIEQVKKLKPLDRLKYWITERESVRLKKEVGEPRPWTDDHILQTYRFCNVRRMDDAVSQWLLKNWYELFFGHKNMLLACAMARHFNKPSALQSVGFPTTWAPELFKKILRDRKAAGETIFNGAYMVRGIGTADKTEMVIDKVCQPLHDSPPQLDTNSMQKCVEALLPYWGFSHFMAGQVIADYRWAMQGAWTDRYHWAPCGPGSKRGMNRLHGREKDKSFELDQFNKELEVLIDKLEVLPGNIIHRLEAIDVQNCLCEYDKYNRCLLGEGRPKQLYQGAA